MMEKMVDPITGLKRARGVYREKGPSEILLRVWLRIVYLGPLYHLFERVLGERLHEKLIRAPMVGYWPRIRAPRSFNEHVMHRKLYTDEELYATVSDKYAVREYVRERVGDEPLTDLYHVTTDPATIPFEDLPDQFVVKATHGSNQNVIVKDKESADFEAIRRDCREWLAEDYGVRQREYWYERIEPRIIVEEFLEGDDGGVPKDFKFSVFGGTVEFVQVDYDRFGDHSRRFFTRDWDPLEVRFGGELGPVMNEPERLDEMVEIAETLGEEFDAVRIDLYQPSPDRIAFGEITLADGAGGDPFKPREYDFRFGELWRRCSEQETSEPVEIPAE